MRCAFAPHSAEETGSAKVKNIPSVSQQECSRAQSQFQVFLKPKSKLSPLHSSYRGSFSFYWNEPETELSSLSVVDQESPLCLPQTQLIASALGTRSDTLSYNQRHPVDLEEVKGGLMTRTQLSHEVQVQEGTGLQKNCNRTGKLRRLQPGATLSLLALRLCLILFSP